jgi:colanic acid/amylovoran biosynthesis glycosyltransferase
MASFQCPPEQLFVIYKIPSSHGSRRKVGRYKKRDCCALLIYGYGLAVIFRRPIELRLKICIASSAAEEYSQTFVRDHINRLPGEVLAISGDWPNLRHNGHFILPKRCRLGVRFSKRFPLWVAQRVEKAGENHLASFIKRTEVTLAEFGTVGAGLVRPCQIANVPLVVHFHGYDVYHRRTLEEYQKAYQEMFQSAAAFVVVSKAMREEVVRLGAPREKVHLNSCGVDVLRFSPTNAGSNPPHFLAMGRFIEKKAHFLTILAFERALRQCCDIRLSLAGDGPLLDCCKQLVRALRLEEAVEFISVVNHDRVPTLMRSFRGFVQHSVTAPSGDSEGNPVAVMEAGASGLPVVSTKHAGIPDTVVHGETGLLSEEMDIDSMADHMALLARDPDLASKLGENARVRIQSLYSMERSIQGLYGILETTTKGKMS